MLTQEMAIQDFEYKDGNLYHKMDRKNQIKAGDLAGGVNSSGYKIVRVGGKRQLLHRVIFLMHHGYLPEYVDHIDNDRLNNRVENLRECTFSQNRCNTPKYKNNTSGEKGVTWEKSSGKWHAKIRYLKNATFVGRYLKLEDAIYAIRAKRKEIHGNFTNNN